MAVRLLIADPVLSQDLPQAPIPIPLLLVAVPLLPLRLPLASPRHCQQAVRLLQTYPALAVTMAPLLSLQMAVRLLTAEPVLSQDLHQTPIPIPLPILTAQQLPLRLPLASPPHVQQ